MIIFLSLTIIHANTDNCKVVNFKFLFFYKQWHYNYILNKLSQYAFSAWVTIIICVWWKSKWWFLLCEESRFYECIQEDCHIYSPTQAAKKDNNAYTKRYKKIPQQYQHIRIIANIVRLPCMEIHSCYQENRWPLEKLVSEGRVEKRTRIRVDM